MEKPFIGIKRLFYGPVFDKDVTPSIVQSWFSGATEIKNSHQDTFTYTQDDPETTDYINELTGNSYYKDKTSNGTKTINFTMGEFDFEDKAALQGGEVISDEDGNAIGWKAPTSIEGVKYFGLVGQTKTGNWIIFSNASIIAKADTQEKNIGLGVSAQANDNPNDGVADEYLYAESAITAPATA